MLSNKPVEKLHNLTDQAARTTEQAVQSTQNLAHNALDSVSDTIKDAQQQAAPLLNRATEQASAMAQRGMDTVRETSKNLVDNAQRATDRTVSYVKDEPVKAMLIAAATGAALMAMLSMISHSRNRN